MGGGSGGRRRTAGHRPHITGERSILTGARSTIPGRGQDPSARPALTGGRSSWRSVAHPYWRGLNLCGRRGRRGRVDGGRTAQSLRRPEPGEAERAALACTARRGADGRARTAKRPALAHGADGTARRGGRGRHARKCTLRKAESARNCTLQTARAKRSADGAVSSARKMHPEKFGGENFKLNVPTALFVWIFCAIKRRARPDFTLNALNHRRGCA